MCQENGKLKQNRPNLLIFWFFTLTCDFIKKCIKDVNSENLTFEILKMHRIFKIPVSCPHNCHLNMGGRQNNFDIGGLNKKNDRGS